MPLQQFLSSEMLWGFSALIKLVYTSDDPAQYWMRTIHLREIYHSLECDTKAISVGEIGWHEKSLQQSVSQYKGNASPFYGPIAYSVLFGVPLQDSTVNGELSWQSNKLLLQLA